jgi:putative hydrolase of the HAD superfamily
MTRDRWTHIRGVFFDLYGTLLIYGDMAAAERAWCEVQHTALRERGLRISLDEFHERTRGMFEAPEPPPSPRDSGLTLNERRKVVFYESLGLSVPLSAMRELDERAQDAWQAYIPLDPVAVDVLKQLRRAKPVALVSNYDHPPHVRRLLARLGLNPLFDCVVISGEVDVKKPDPRIFDFALTDMGLQPEEVVYVGDASVDVDASRAAGIASIRIDRDGGSWSHAEDADLVIASLTELPPLFT